MAARHKRLISTEKCTGRRRVFLSLKEGQGPFVLPVIVCLVIFLAPFLFARPGYANPCGSIVTYRIGQVDERFGVSRSEFSQLVKKAADTWSVPFSAPLFEETSNGKILIEMVYDHRQEATQNMAQLGADAGENLKSYAVLKGQHDKLLKEYARKKEALERNAAEYNRRREAYLEENRAALHRGRVSGETHQYLQEERAALSAMYAELPKRQKELAEIAAKAEQLVPQMTNFAGQHKTYKTAYNKEAGRLKGGFCIGAYYRYGGKSIIIYQYADKDHLVQTLAHEFGHALGIRHLGDRNALMFPYDTGKRVEKLAPADISALKDKCKK